MRVGTLKVYKWIQISIFWCLFNYSFSLELNYLSSGRNLLLNQVERRAIKPTIVLIKASSLLDDNEILSFIWLPSLTPYVEEIIRTFWVYYDVTDQLLIMYIAAIKPWEQLGYQRTAYRMSIDFTKTYDFVKKEVYVTFPFKSEYLWNKLR